MFNKDWPQNGIYLGDCVFVGVWPWVCIWDGPTCLSVLRVTLLNDVLK